MYYIISFISYIYLSVDDLQYIFDSITWFRLDIITNTKINKAVVIRPPLNRIIYSLFLFHLKFSVVSKKKKNYYNNR